MPVLCVEIGNSSIELKLKILQNCYYKIERISINNSRSEKPKAVKLKLPKTLKKTKTETDRVFLPFFFGGVFFLLKQKFK